MMVQLLNLSEVHASTCYITPTKHNATYRLLEPVSAKSAGKSQSLDGANFYKRSQEAGVQAVRRCCGWAVFPAVQDQVN